MRIYKVNIENRRHGRNFRSETIAARTFDEAIKKAKRGFWNSQERIESVELVAVAER